MFIVLFLGYFRGSEVVSQSLTVCVCIDTNGKYFLDLGKKVFFKKKKT